MKLVFKNRSSNLHSITRLEVQRFQHIYQTSKVQHLYFTTWYKELKMIVKGTPFFLVRFCFCFCFNCFPSKPVKTWWLIIRTNRLRNRSCKTSPRACQIFGDINTTKIFFQTVIIILPLDPKKKKIWRLLLNQQLLLLLTRLLKT